MQGHLPAGENIRAAEKISNLATFIVVRSGAAAFVLALRLTTPTIT
jgi:hypothetical protein